MILLDLELGVAPWMAMTFWLVVFFIFMWGLVTLIKHRSKTKQLKNKELQIQLEKLLKEKAEKIF